MNATVKRKHLTVVLSTAEAGEWVRQAAGGDRDAQQRLLLAFIGRIRGRVGRLVGRTDEADDIVQQACVELLRSLRGFRGDASLEFWVDRITTNVVYKHFRTTQRRQRRVTLVEDIDRESALDSERRLEWRAGVEAARDLLAQLDPPHRMVFLLVAVDGRTLPEAAAMLDLSLAAAKSRYLRARREVCRLVESAASLRALLDGEESGA